MTERILMEENYKRILPSKFRSRKNIIFSIILLFILLGEIFIIFNGISYVLLQTFPKKDLKIFIEGVEEKEQIKIKKLVSNYFRRKNILFLNLEELNSRILKIPSISEVKIKKILPDEIRIYIKREEPFAYLISGRIYLIDQHGRIIQEILNNEDMKFLPMIYIEEGISNSIIQRGLRILKELRNYKEEYLKLKLIRYNYSEDIFFIELKDAILLVNGEDIREELDKYIRYKRDIEEIKGNNGILDLRFSNQIILKQNL